MRVLSQDTHKVLVPAGRYFLGDPCYSVPTELWEELLESCKFFDDPVGTVTVEADGIGAVHSVLAFSTRWGDGEYDDDEGNSYPVDAGLIGLVPEKLVDHSRYGDTNLGRWVTFDRDTLCTTCNGDMRFGSIHINTDTEESYEDNYYGNEEE